MFISIDTLPSVARQTDGQTVVFGSIVCALLASRGKNIRYHIETVK